MRTAVIIFDPAGREPEGELLTGNALLVAASRGVVLLPVEPSLLRRGGASGYAKRSYGRGWHYNPVAASRGCPLVLHAAADYSVLEWRARLQAEEVPGEDGEARAYAPPFGSLRMAADTAQVGAVAAGLAPETPPVQLHTLGAPDAAGGWTIGGRARMNLSGDLFLALQLYGQAGGARAVWFAASQTR